VTESENARKALIYETIAKIVGRKDGVAFGIYSKLAKENPDIVVSPSLYLNEIASAAEVGFDEAEKAFHFVRQAFADAVCTAVLCEDDAIWQELFKGGSADVHFIYAYGQLELLNKKRVLISGMKMPSLEGRGNSFAASGEASEAGCAIASSLDVGIPDGVSQHSLGCGYPLILVIPAPISQDCIRPNALTLSIFPPSVKAEKWFVVPRNRFMISISDVFVNVEEKDGGPLWELSEIAYSSGKKVVLFDDAVSNPRYKFASSFAKKDGVAIYRKKGDLKKLLKGEKQSKAKKKEPKKVESDQFELF